MLCIQYASEFGRRVGEALGGPKTSVWGLGCHISPPITSNKTMDG